MKEECRAKGHDNSNKMATMPAGKLVLEMALPNRDLFEIINLSRIRRINRAYK